MTHSAMLRGISVSTSNWMLALLFGLFAYAHTQRFLEQPRLSLMLIVAMEALLIVFVVVRKNPDKTWHSWKTWLSTSGGTLFPLLLRPTEVTNDLLSGQIIQVAGVFLQIVAVLSLNRSFGLLPAHRGVKSNGLYRLVRHPLYAAYTIALTGYLINNFSLYNVAVLILGTSLQIMRIHNEEQLLLEYSDYVVFSDRTRWRLFPYIW